MKESVVGFTFILMKIKARFGCSDRSKCTQTACFQAALTLEAAACLALRSSKQCLNKANTHLRFVDCQTITDCSIMTPWNTSPHTSAQVVFMLDRSKFVSVWWDRNWL